MPLALHPRGQRTSPGSKRGRELFRQDEGIIHDNRNIRAEQTSRPSAGGSAPSPIGRIPRRPRRAATARQVLPEASADMPLCRRTEDRLQGHRFPPPLPHRSGKGRVQAKDRHVRQVPAAARPCNQARALPGHASVHQESPRRSSQIVRLDLVETAEKQDGSHSPKVGCFLFSCTTTEELACRSDWIAIPETIRAFSIVKLLQFRTARE